MEESLLWIIDYYFGQNLCFKVKISLIDGFFFLQAQLFLPVDYCDVFISCLDCHSDGTHSPQRIHW